MTLSTTEQDRQNTRRRQAWDKQAGRYDRQIGWWERRVFGQDNRAWAAQRARGDVLEVAIGTGLNIPLYDTEVKLTGVDLSPEMLDVARRRVADLDRTVELREGDAHRLAFIDGDHMTRRPAEVVERLGFDIVERDRFRWGIVERLVATKPGDR